MEKRRAFNVCLHARDAGATRYKSPTHCSVHCDKASKVVHRSYDRRKTARENIPKRVRGGFCESRTRQWETRNRVDGEAAQTGGKDGYGIRFYQF